MDKHTTPPTFLQLAREYYLVSFVCIAVIIGLILQLTGYGTAARWLLSVFSLVMAAKLAWGMIQELQEGKWGIDILAVTAILSTVAVGEYWASIVIVLMLTGGEALEDYANRRATRELSALLERAPRITHRQKKNGEVEDISVADVAIGDILVIRPSEIMPVDAVLLDDAAFFDESSLTGESLPVEHKKNDELLSGIVNADQVITVKAVRTAHNSQYQQIVELVKAASSSEAPFVRLADRYAVPFTAISFLIAGVAWAIDGNPIRFAEVLVVATPCPLLLGAPIAFISGMSRSAKHGIIVKNGAVLEKLSRIQTVAFDKTGTLTFGEPEVSGVHPAKGVSKDELLVHAASAERQSSHVLAGALVSYAKSKKVALATAKNVKETTAQGIAATVNGRHVLVGKLSFLQENGVKSKENANVAGETAVYVALDGSFIGTITFADKIRENSRRTLQKLHEIGIHHTLMLSGDTKATAERIARELGIETVLAECLPKDKVDAVAKIKERPVMMVGDGVNDAPVLAAADVGMAMGARGSTIASEAADVVVVLDDISRSALAVEIGKRTMRIALQSIWIGIAISVGLMLVASTGFIPAVVGAGLQEVVDVVVIINALRAHGSWKKATA